MQAVVFEYDIHTAVALLARHAEEVHRGIIEAHQVDHLVGLVGADEVGMRRNSHREASAAKVETAALTIGFKIGEETQKERQPDHKHQMKVGIALRCRVEPLHAVDHVVEEALRLLFVARGIAQQFGHKKYQLNLYRVGAERQPGPRDANLGEALQRARRTLREVYVKQHERLEKHLAHPSFPTRRDLHDKRLPTRLTGKNINN